MTRRAEPEEIELAGLLDEQEERDRERRVAEGVHDERLLAGPDGARALVPEVDQQVGGEADHAPSGEQEQHVAGLDEQEHGEDEERLVGVVASLLVVTLHVADGVREDQEADARDDEHHEDGQRVDDDVEADVQVAGREPGPERRDVDALLRVLGEELREGVGRGDERHADAAGRQQTGQAAADPVPGEGDRHDGGRRSEERDPGRGDQLSPSAC